jgi:hypothetical protein
MKVALGMKRLSLKNVTAEGLRGGLLYWGTGIYVKEGPRYGRLSPWGPLYVRGEPGIGRGTHILGTLNDE